MRQMSGGGEVPRRKMLTPCFLPLHGARARVCRPSRPLGHRCDPVGRDSFDAAVAHGVRAQLSVGPPRAGNMERTRLDGPLCHASARPMRLRSALVWRRLLEFDARWQWEF